MPNRALIAAATIVWALGVLVALIFGLPTLLTIEGVNVDIGLIVNALVAAGTFSAAAAAVWVATSDRRVRKQERDAEDEAQAKLVVISAQCQENPLELQIRAVNYGTRAITDVTFVDVVVESHDRKLWPTTGPFPPVAAPGRGLSLFAFNPEVYGREHPYYISPGKRKQ